MDTDRITNIGSNSKIYFTFFPNQRALKDFLPFWQIEFLLISDDEDIDERGGAYPFVVTVLIIKHPTV